MDIKYRLAFFVIELLDVQEVILLAESFLLKGYNSDSLNMLAAETAEDNNRIEIDKKMRNVLSELNINIPTKVDAVKLCICFWCERIASKHISCKQGMKALADLFIHAEMLGVGDRYAQAFDAEKFYAYYDFYEEMDYYDKTGSCIENEFIKIFNGKKYNKQDAIEYIDNQVLLETKNYFKKYSH